ncbi:hypothetical protein RJ639_047588, partial [Escallonia herrerae]
MGVKPLEWYCQPVANGIWAQATDSTFGAYTPCYIDSLVICISHLVLLGLCLYRLWLIKNDSKAKRFCLTSKYYNCILGLLAGYCTGEPLFRLATGISIFNLDGQDGFSPFEMVSLILEALSWCSMLVMIVVETRMYIREFRWYVRFGVLYVLVGDAVIFNVILSVKDFCVRFASLPLNKSTNVVADNALFGLLLVFYIPHLDPYVGYIPLRTETLDDTRYEALLGGENICPEKHATIFSRIYFGWMTPLMQQGYKRPITEKDVWKLDAWDQTQMLSRKFQNCWAEESQKAKPWLLRALNCSLGQRFWYGGLFKIGNDLSQFVGPVMLNHLLQSLERGDPAWIGYVYAFSIFVGVIPVLKLTLSYLAQSLGVLCEAQYFQNVMRVGFRLRSTLVAAVFRKSLRLTHEGRKSFPSGRITNMMTTDANALQACSRHNFGFSMDVRQICQQLHALWSAPFRIIIAMVLLYQQLGVASLLGSLMLVLMFPIQ